MRLTFEPIDGSAEAQVVDLPDTPRLESQVLLGRTTNCDVRLPDPSVSRAHCRIAVDPASHSVKICDLGSRNGTYVNRELVTAQCNVHDGDEIVVGNVPLRIEFVDGSDVWERVAARYRAAQTSKPRRITLVGPGSDPT